MSYQEREIILPDPSELASEEDILVTALHWSGTNGGKLASLLIVGYLHHGIRYVQIYMPVKALSHESFQNL